MSGQGRRTAGQKGMNGQATVGAEAAAAGEMQDTLFRRSSRPPESSITMLTPANDPESTFTQRPLPPSVLQAAIPEVSPGCKILYMTHEPSIARYCNCALVGDTRLVSRVRVFFAAARLSPPLNIYFGSSADDDDILCSNAHAIIANC